MELRTVKGYKWNPKTFKGYTEEEKLLKVAKKK